jgi:hypothetical protein
MPDDDALWNRMRHEVLNDAERYAQAYEIQQRLQGPLTEAFRALHAVLVNDSADPGRILGATFIADEILTSMLGKARETVSDELGPLFPEPGSFADLYVDVQGNRVHLGRHTNKEQ